MQGLYILEIPFGFLCRGRKQKWKGRMETTQWITGMAKGRKGQGNGIRPVVMKGGGANVFAFAVGSLCLSEKFAEKWVVELVTASS
jgi:hypothetical protein